MHLYVTSSKHLQRNCSSHPRTYNKIELQDWYIFEFPLPNAATGWVVYNNIDPSASAFASLSREKGGQHCFSKLRTTELETSGKSWDMERTYKDSAVEIIVFENTNITASSSPSGFDILEVYHLVFW